MASILAKLDYSPDMDFFRAGADSLAAIALASSLSRRFAVAVTPYAVLQHPTPRLLGSHIQILVADDERSGADISLAAVAT